MSPDYDYGREKRDADEKLAKLGMRPGSLAPVAGSAEMCEHGTLLELGSCVFCEVDALREHNRTLRDDREWLNYALNFLRLPLKIDPSISNFDRPKILAAFDAALRPPNTKLPDA